MFYVKLIDFQAHRDAFIQKKTSIHFSYRLIPCPYETLRNVCTVQQPEATDIGNGRK